MAVRNFWISTNIDGRNTELSGGPRAKDGGFELRIYQRDNGSIIKAAELSGRVDRNGNLILRCSVRKNDDTIQHLEFETKR